MCFESCTKSGCSFPKFHQLCHYYHAIKEYGVPNLWYTGPWERSHRYLCRVPWLRTGRNTERLHEQVTLRVVVADRVRQVVAVFSTRSPQVSGLKATKTSAVGEELVEALVDGAAEDTGDYDDDCDTALRSYESNGYLSLSKRCVFRSLTKHAHQLFACTCPLTFHLFSSHLFGCSVGR